MKIKAAACMLALVSAPALASAQTSSPAPAPPSPVAAPAASAPAHAWPTKSGITPADLAQLEAFGVKFRATFERQQALMERSRAALFAAVTPTHRPMVAQIIGELAMSSTPDATVAAKRIDAVLSTAEKAAVLAAFEAPRAEMAALREQHRAQDAQFAALVKRIASARAAAGWPTRPTPMARPSAAPPAIHKEWKTRVPDAGWDLVVAAQYGPRIRGIVIPPERWGFFGNS